MRSSVSLVSAALSHIGVASLPPPPHLPCRAALVLRQLGGQGQGGGHDDVRLEQVGKKPARVYVCVCVWHGLEVLSSRFCLGTKGREEATMVLG